MRYGQTKVSYELAYYLSSSSSPFSSSSAFPKTREAKYDESTSSCWCCSFSSIGYGKSYPPVGSKDAYPPEGSAQPYPQQRYPPQGYPQQGYRPPYAPQYPQPQQQLWLI